MQSNEYRTFHEIFTMGRGVALTCRWGGQHSH